MSNIPTIRRLYQAFSRGDVETILEHLSPEVEWDYPATGTSVPWLQHRVGREAVAEFFRAVAGLEMHQFQIKEFLENGDVVVVLLDVDFTVKETGRRVREEDEIHVWRFDKEC